MSRNSSRDRGKCSFNIEELTNFIDGGKEFTVQRRNLVKFLLTDPELKTQVPWEYLSYVERYEEAVRKSCLAFRKFEKFLSNSDTADTKSLFGVLFSLIFSAILEDGVPFAVHLLMFIPVIQSQGTIKQQSYWIGRAWNFNILGAYAQTEMGHGTFIRGLETTAHYDPETEEFVLNSPTLTSYKWWPGGLGHTVNYAVVIAQLYTQNENRGIHSFIVQLRDEETHMPLPGIHIGEIGCKMGNNSINNGYLGLKNVRIPANHMLMKHAQVLKDGTYVKNAIEKISYGPMVLMRVALVRDGAASYLARAVTIATRFSYLAQNGGSCSAVDSRLRQHHILPHIANSLAMIFSSRWLWSVYEDVFESGEEADLRKLPELHALACCLKAVCSSDSARAIEECRKMCEGHGSNISSKFHKLYSVITAAETYEGENTVLLLQTARYLIKKYTNKDINETTQYFTKNFNKKSWTNNMDHIVDVFYQVAQGRIADASRKFSKKVASGLKPELAWNECSIHLIKCAEAHCRSYISQQFYSTVQTAQISNSLRHVLLLLCQLHGVYWILNDLGAFLTYSSIKTADVESIETRRNELMDEIGPIALSLVDAFDFDPDMLYSSQGCDDTNYRRLLEAEKTRICPLKIKKCNESQNERLNNVLRTKL